MNKPMTLYLIKQQPLSTGQLSEQSKQIEQIQRMLRLFPEFQNVMIRERTLQEFKDFFYSTVEVNEKYNQGDTILPLKSEFRICPIFVKLVGKDVFSFVTNNHVKTVYENQLIFGAAQRKQGVLIGYLMAKDPLTTTDFMELFNLEKLNKALNS